MTKPPNEKKVEKMRPGEKSPEIPGNQNEKENGRHGGSRAESAKPQGQSSKLKGNRKEESGMRFAVEGPGTSSLEVGGKVKPAGNRGKKIIRIENRNQERGRRKKAES